MMSVTILHEFVDLFSLLLAYCMTVPFIGWFHAWVAYKAGDDAGQQMGLMNPNLLAHIDPIGLLFLPLMRIGWGRRIPVRFHSISPSYRWLKFIIALFANTCAYFLATSLIIFILSFMFKGNAIGVLLAHDSAGLTGAVGASSAFSLAIAGFLQKCAFLNLGMTRLSFVINTCYLLVSIVAQYWYKKTEREINQEYLFFLFIFIWLFFFQLPFGSMLVGSVLNVGKGLAAIVT